jgi:hypothetical protein
MTDICVRFCDSSERQKARIGFAFAGEWAGSPERRTMRGNWDVLRLNPYARHI